MIADLRPCQVPPQNHRAPISETVSGHAISLAHADDLGIPEQKCIGAGDDALRVGRLDRSLRVLPEVYVEAVEVLVRVHAVKIAVPQEEVNLFVEEICRKNLQEGVDTHPDLL